MTQSDEWRELLERANEVPGRIQVRPGAGAVLRAHARRGIRQRRAAALAGALLLTVGGGLAVAKVDLLTGARVPVAPAHRSQAVAPGVLIGDLATPIEMRLVEGSGACPLNGGVPTWDGSECYRLGPTQMRILAVGRAAFGQPAGSPTQPGATVGERSVISVELTQTDRAAYADLTGSHVGQRIAVVVDNRVLGAPEISERIDSDVLLMPGPPPMVSWAAAQLTP
ncbi:MAG TPA: hypothetical protein VLL08_07925 [Kineosporiaceae bacterium]|nr:hypothetical protein [Kineosporiaceae bacterium]